MVKSTNFLPCNARTGSACTTCVHTGGQNALSWPHGQRGCTREDCQTSASIAGVVRRSTGATCPGGATPTPMPSGSLRSCSSRPASRWSSNAIRPSWHAFPRWSRWPWRLNRTCWRCGAAWATTAAPACCIRPRSMWRTSHQGNLPARPRSCVSCPASAPIPPPPSPASPMARR